MRPIRLSNGPGSSRTLACGGRVPARRSTSAVCQFSARGASRMSSISPAASRPGRSSTRAERRAELGRVGGVATLLARHRHVADDAQAVPAVGREAARHLARAGAATDQRHPAQRRLVQPLEQAAPEVEQGGVDAGVEQQHRAREGAARHEDGGGAGDRLEAGRDQQPARQLEPRQRPEALVEPDQREQRELRRQQPGQGAGEVREALRGQRERRERQVDVDAQPEGGVESERGGGGVAERAEPSRASARARGGPSSRPMLAARGAPRRAV